MFPCSIDRTQIKQNDDFPLSLHTVSRKVLFFLLKSLFPVRRHFYVKHTDKGNVFIFLSYNATTETHVIRKHKQPGLWRGSGF